MIIIIQLNVPIFIFIFNKKTYSLLLKISLKYILEYIYIKKYYWKIYHAISGPAQGVGDIGPRLGWHLIFLY